MEIVTLDKDIKVFFITASSFPSGIVDAHKQLHGMVPFSPDRKYFGISRPENGVIIYRAAAEEKKDGEAQQYNCETLTLKKGKYISVVLHNFRKDPQNIERTFQKLISGAGIDPQGYCVEWYSNEEEAVRCMIRLADS